MMREYSYRFGECWSDNMTGENWEVAWSSKESRVASVLCTADGMIVASGTDVINYDSQGNIRWRRSMPFTVYRLGVDESNIGLLCGQGFHLLRTSDGIPIHEGRATAGGFRDLMPRPSGGWILSDRVGHLHLFNIRGIGIRRLNTGEIRRLIGWLDREHILIHNEDGRIRCLRLVQQDYSRFIDEKNWSWTSRLSNGQILLQATDGEVWVGMPHPFGWDELDRIETVGTEPIDSTRSGDGWWILDIDGLMQKLPPAESLKEMIGGEFISGNGIDVMATASQNGLIRWWESSKLSSERRAITQKMVAQERERLDWENRKNMFEEARKSEDDGMLSRATELYQALGRSEDVRRMLERQSRGD